MFLIPFKEVEEGENIKEVGEYTISFNFIAKVKGIRKEINININILIEKDSFRVALKAALLEPVKKAEEGFKV
jgi:hypothetical protein